MKYDVCWSVSGTITVEADSKEDARDKVECICTADLLPVVEIEIGNGCFETGTIEPHACEQCQSCISCIEIDSAKRTGRCTETNTIVPIDAPSCPSYIYDENED